MRRAEPGAVPAPARAVDSPRICVNGRFLTRRATGVDRFATEVLRAIAALRRNGDPLARSMEFEILRPPGAATAQLDMPSRSVGRLTGQAWEQFELPRHVPTRGLLLNLCNTGPALMRNQTVVIHDAATVRVPAAFSRGFRLWYRFLMRALGWRAAQVVTVSGFSRRELADAFSISDAKLYLMGESGEHILRADADTQALERFGLSSRPYVLAVSSMAAHKNFRLVLQALGALDGAPFDVAIAGGANPRVFGTAGHLHSANVRWLGYVSDAELRALYAGAMCFVFPSIYEGFGIPPLEAMECGCPVIASNAASIPEVCGDAALYFDPADATALAALLQRVAADEGLRAELAARGRARARQFTWETAARQLLRLCQAAQEGL